jgi:predicted amidophosphoribosyltransferase
MKYDRLEVESAALWKLDGDDYYVLSYPPTRRRTIATDFVLDFKNNDGDAVTIATALVLVAIKKLEPILKKHHSKYIVATPPSKAGRPNLPCEMVCEAVAKEFNWIRHLPRALERTKSVPKAAWAKPWDRPTYDDHRNSIDYRGAVRDEKASFILVDDVITQGNVSSACRDILIEKALCRHVTGVFLGRTE